MNRRIVGVYQNGEEATLAIEELHKQGYSPEQISVIAKDREEMAEISDETGTKAPEGLATGAAAGGFLGGMAGLLAGIGVLAIPGVGPILAAGPIVATLTGAAVGAGTGGLVGGLIGMGISEEDAREYNRYVDEGRILVLVDTLPEEDPARQDGLHSDSLTNTDTYR